MRGVGRPEIAGHAVALAVVAVGLRVGATGERGELGAADEDMGFSGCGIKVNELAAIDIGEVLAVGRPGEALRRMADERAMGEEVFNGERLCGRAALLGLRGEGRRAQRAGKSGRKQNEGGTGQCGILRKRRRGLDGEKGARASSKGV
jgi:hypothetical protein